MSFVMYTTCQPPRRRRRLGAAFVVLCLAGAGLPLAAAASAPPAAMVASTERVQAAYLHRFLNYVDWPASVLAQADTPYVIGVAGDDTVAD